MLKIHCAEFRSDHELARMKGAPPGYVGWRECIPLFHEVRLKEVRLKSDLALVLFDEIEKAHPALWDLLLGLLDKGEVILNDNTRTDFRRTLVFLTGNAGAREVAEALSGGLGFAAGAAAPVPHSGISGVAGRAAARLFAPEFRTRLTATITYRPLGWEDMQRICRLELARLAARLRNREQDWVAMQYEAAAVERIAAGAVKATSKAAFIAARNLARFIEHLDKNANVLAINVDSRMEDVTRASVHALARVDVAAAAIGTQGNDVGYQATLALGAARGTMENLERLAANPALARSAQNLERSTAHLEKTSAASAEAAERLRDMLSPRRPSFWRRLLGLLPRPAANSRKP